MTGEPITRKQVAEQLNRCARFDGRTLDPQTFEDWYDLLGVELGVPYEDVKAAITAHYATSEKWIMPAHIVEHCARLAAARQLEEARQNPPGCGCGVRYVTSQRPGSQFALPGSPHAEGCRSAVYAGVLVFNPAKGTWGCMSVDPDEFDEEQWLAGQARLAEALERGGSPWAVDPGRPDWASRLAITGWEEGDVVD